MVAAIRTLLASGHWAWQGTCPGCRATLHLLIAGL
jgi:hypothetical protein